MNNAFRNLFLAGTVVLALAAGVLGARAVAIPAGSAPVTAVLGDGQDAGQAGAGPASFAPLVKAVKPAVVNISIRGHRAGEAPPGAFPGFPPGGPFREFFQQHFGPGGPPGALPGSRPRPPAEFRAVGSGFIISPDGLVVTNNHVIQQAEEIDVVLQDGTRYPATVRGRDAKTDLALLQVAAKAPLPYVELGSSEDTEVGDWVVAVGNPFGLGGTVTAGIVSARGRDIQAGPFDDFLQVDAPINRGNSGGPLFDARGRVIGINTAIYSPSGGSIGIGFAIPSELAADVIGQLEENGRVERGWLGIEFQPVTEELAASLGLESPGGALVASVLADGPAEKAGLRVGDVILGLDGEALQEPKDLPRLVAGARAGSRVALRVLRDGRERTVRVTIGRSEAEARLADAAQEASKPAGLGVALSELTPELRQRYGLAATHGVLVTGVQRGSPAAQAGLRPGQVITMVGQSRVATPGQVAEAVSEAREAERPSLMLMVEQSGARRFVAVDLLS